MNEPLRLALTRDLLGEDGRPLMEAAAWHALANHPGLDVTCLADRPPMHPLDAEDVRAFDLVIMKRNPVTAAVLEGGDVRLGLIARMGVGFDHLDLSALDAAGTLVTITPDAVRRPVASSIMALILALAHHLPMRDADARSGDWGRRMKRTGIGLEGRNLGLVGLGNIGAEVLRLIAPFGMRHLVFDPARSATEVGALGGELTTLDRLFTLADFVVLACPLNAATRALVDERRLRSMKPSAYLVNTARGELVDEKALVEALRERWIAGAGIDVFEHEPPVADHPLFDLPNVILSQHNLCMTDEVNRIGHASVVKSVLDYIAGRRPDHVVNQPAPRPGRTLIPS